MSEVKKPDRTVPLLTIGIIIAFSIGLGLGNHVYENFTIEEIQEQQKPVLKLKPLLISSVNQEETEIIGKVTMATHTGNMTRFSVNNLNLQVADPDNKIRVDEEIKLTLVSSQPFCVVVAVLENNTAVANPKAIIGMNFTNYTVLGEDTPECDPQSTIVSLKAWELR
jgi:hypothetical protein